MNLPILKKNSLKTKNKKKKIPYKTIMEAKSMSKGNK